MPSYRIAAALTVFALGLGTGALLQARPHPTAPAYVIGEVNVKDMQAFQRYAAQVPATLKPYGGRFLVRGGRTVPLEGEPPGERVVVIRFDSLRQARAWYGSAAYGALRPIRQQAAQTRNFIVEGTPPAS